MPLRLCVLEHIDGDNLFHLKYEPTLEEVDFLGGQAALIASIPIQPTFIFDSWAVVNFATAYSEKSQYLSEGDDELISLLATEFPRLDLRNLPHCFVHGDIIATNVLRDNSGALWIVDFATSNYYPRIQELAVLACNLCFDELDEEQSLRKLAALLESYQKRTELTQEEIDVLPLYIKLAHAMHVINASYEEVVNKNLSEENKYWLRQGRAGLRQS